MRLARIIPPAIALALGLALSLAASVAAVNLVERRSQADVQRILGLAGQDWVTVETDGLQVILGGMAPDEATRFQALREAGTVVDSARLIDAMGVAAGEPVQPPRFSIEILRNDDGVSLIGLVPAEMDTETVVGAIREMAGAETVTDLLDVADYPPPEGWSSALSYGIEALATLPRSKISIAADRVEIVAISDSVNQQQRIEAELARKAPPGLVTEIRINAPRPVITPFTLRFLIDQDGARFDACSTDTEGGRDKILAAAVQAGLSGKATCTIGLGVPSPSWDDAVVLAIGKLAEVGGGSVTFSDADITFVGTETTDQQSFDAIVGALKAELPDVFSLHAILPEPVAIDGTGDADSGPPEFVATLSPEGNLQLRGRIADERSRIAAESFAQAGFGSNAVGGSLRVTEGLPPGWTIRVLAALEALEQLGSGTVVAQPDFVEIRGKTGNPDARAEIARILSEKLGESENYRISVSYEEALDPMADIPTPQECVDNINAILAANKITFAPSSSDIDGDGLKVIDDIAAVMKDCSEVPMEVGGHTDSQGREVMNQALSQARAQAIINALLARRVLTTNLTAVGYGESQPIADNDTEEGREANRRIEFKLIVPDEAATETAEGPAGEPVSVGQQNAGADEDGSGGADTVSGDAPAGETDEPN